VAPGRPWGAGAGPCGCAVTDFVRGLTTVGTDAYVGTDASDVAGIPQADNVAKWNGSAWSALGADSGGLNGWLPATTTVNALTGAGSNLFVTGSFLNANGDARADNVAYFDGTSWHPLGSDVAGNGRGAAPASHWRSSIGSSTRAAASPAPAATRRRTPSRRSRSRRSIAYPTPTVTPSPSPNPTPTVTPGPTPTPAPADTTAPTTSLRSAQIKQAKRKATFRFASGEPGSRFRCKLDNKQFEPCTSPRTYAKLKPGKHVFRVKARDRAGDLDSTPVVKRFEIKRR
jgi:hypothetical protein